MRHKYILILLILSQAFFSGCATTGEYSGYAGYHTYKTDNSKKTRMGLLLFFFTPLMSIPAVYALNELYLHNESVSLIFSFIKLDVIMDFLGDLI
ncbi:MAG: hypothetical protein LBC53_00800 [Spirochaetaceae bacterium]|nr:hypothetical protein [Spirochaetaceae bacterium]